MSLDQRIAHDHLVRICFIDYDREMAFVAVYKNPQTGQDEILGVGRLIKEPGEGSAEFALLITDHYQRQGLGTELLSQLIQFGRDEKLRLITSNILVENKTMQEVCTKLGFDVQYLPEDKLMRAELEL